MKTKIIYIGGGEIFDTNDIRTAFEEVRTALNLGTDTVLFGVPVDENESIGAQPEPAPKQIAEPAPVVKKMRAKKEKIEEIEEPENKKPDDAPVIPILPVLSAKEDEPALGTEPIPTKIEDIVLDDAPVAVCATIESVEKTLEELLENMTPLTEDEEESKSESAPVATLDTEPIDTDATLSKLAAEFADAQNTIQENFADESAPNATTRPKSSIGKLKNILPFKKAKTDNGGLMGDLFGWAGLAANDDDQFGVPGFFASAK